MPERLFRTHRRAVSTALICAAIMVGSFGLAGYSLYTAHNASCTGRDRLLGVVGGILRSSEPTPGQYAQMATARRRHVRTFFANAYLKIEQARC